MNILPKQITILLPCIRPKAPVLLLLAILLLMATAISASVGAVSIPLGTLLSGGLSDSQEAVLSSIRLPRILLAIIVGVSLAVSGAAMQGLFRNPLADPGLIGISGGAAVAVGFVIVGIGPAIGVLGLYGISIAAFLGAFTVSLAIFAIAKRGGTVSVISMLLAGIAINAIAFAGTGLFMFISDDDELRALTFWTMGSLGGALWPAIIVAATVVIPATFLLIKNAQKLNILLLGEQEAQHLGVDSEKLKRVIIVCTALSVGVAVAVSGIIGFVGLVVPHLIRLTIGPDHRLLIPASALLGAILLLVADTFARTVVSPAEIPVGILTSLIGGPFFLWLLINQYARRFGI